MTGKKKPRVTAGMKKPKLPARTKKEAPAIPATAELKKHENVLLLRQYSDEAVDTATAREFIKPSVIAAQTIKRLPTLTAGYLEISALTKELETQCIAVRNGDLGRCEVMLAAQTYTLDAIFNHLVSLGAQNLIDNIEHGDTLYRLAFKAQAQCRATIEALAEIKNPRSVAFVKQANIAGGDQQVNNGAPSRTEEKTIAPNKLLEAEYGERVDIGTAGAAGVADSQMETVDAIHRAANKRG
jgi:hypothetical protein